MTRTQLKHLVALAIFATASLSPTAFAQYVWLDEKGVKQYSDMPPPASVPLKRILKQPGSPSRALSAAPAEPAAETTLNESAAKKEKAPMTLAEKNADFQKRRAEQAEKEKKAAEEAQLAANKAKTCEHARAYQRALQSGERVARTDKNGERHYLNDQERAKEIQEANRVLNDCK